MGAIVVVLTWACAIGITTTASRMTWSFARDKGTPFSNIISKVSPRTKVPAIALGIVVTFAGLLTLIYVGSYTAFNDIVSLTITGFYGSYFLPAVFLLWHRVKGHVLPYGSLPAPDPSSINADPFSSSKNPEEKPAPQSYSPSDRRVSVAQAQLVWGPWHIPGILGTINNAYACTYMIFVVFWSVWPPQTPVTASTMNYSIVVTGGVIIFSIVWYFVKGRKEYHGPRIDSEVAQIMRLGSIVEI
jgi:choline transport protein